jgi:hypothetical protein
MADLWIPRPDQRLALDFLEARDSAAVWSGTGSGKTAMAGLWMAERMHDRFTAARALIVAPRLVAVHGWPGQMRRWGHMAPLGESMRVLGAQDFGLTAADMVTIRKADGSSRVKRVPRGSEFTVDPQDGVLGERRASSHTFEDKRATKRHLQSLRERVHLVSWDFFPWLVKAYGSNFPYDMVVFDESSFLRDQDSERSRAARFAVHKLGVVEHQLQLTASPGDNHLEALWHQTHLLRRGLLGETLTQFRETFCNPGARNWQTGQVYDWVQNGAMSGIMQQRIGTVAISLPESLGIEVLQVEQPAGMSNRARSAYFEVEATSVWVEGENRVVAGSEAVVHAKLRQIANGFVYLGDTMDETRHVLELGREKMERVEELIEAMPGQVLIAYEWSEELRRLKATLGRHVKDIRERDAMGAFLAGKLKALAVHPASAGHGVDGLQARTNQIVWTCVPQDLELFRQTNGRLKRPGQNEATVMAHMLYVPGTREETILRRTLPRKWADASRILSSVEAAGKIAA